MEIHHLVEQFQGVAPVDKGFLDPRGQTLLQNQGVVVVVANGKNRKAASAHPKPLLLNLMLKACAKWRKKVQTVASPLTEGFAVAGIHVHDLWHFQHRLIRKVLADPQRLGPHRRCGTQPPA